MTAQSFFRRALLLPVVVAIPPLALAVVDARWPGLGDAGAVVEFLALVTGVAAVGSSPVVVLLAIWLRKPRSVRAMRRAAWLAPALVAITLGGWALVVELTSRPGHRSGRGLFIWWVAVLVVGYAYVGAIELAYRIGVKRGRVVPL